MTMWQKAVVEKSSAMHANDGMLLKTMLFAVEGTPVCGCPSMVTTLDRLELMLLKSVCC